MEYKNVSFDQAIDNDYQLYVGSVGHGRISATCQVNGIKRSTTITDVYNYDVYTRYDRGDNRPYSPEECEEYRAAYEALLNDILFEL